MVTSYSQPLLSHHPSDNNGSDDLSSSSGGGGGLRPSLPVSRRLHSYDDLLAVARGGDGATDAYFKRCQTTPGYVSFEDMIGWSEFHGGSSRRTAKDAISDPLDVRAASRLYARPHARHQRRSPGPLGTRRGGVMYRFIKKFICPCLGFVAGIVGHSG